MLLVLDPYNKHVKDDALTARTLRERYIFRGTK